ALLLAHDALRDRHAEAHRGQQEDDREAERDGRPRPRLRGARVELARGHLAARDQRLEADVLGLRVGGGDRLGDRGAQRRLEHLVGAVLRDELEAVGRGQQRDVGLAVAYGALGRSGVVDLDRVDLGGLALADAQVGGRALQHPAGRLDHRHVVRARTSADEGGDDEDTDDQDDGEQRAADEGLVADAGGDLAGGDEPPQAGGSGGGAHAEASRKIWLSGRTTRANSTTGATAWAATSAFSGARVVRRTRAELSSASRTSRPGTSRSAPASAWSASRIR